MKYDVIIIGSGPGGLFTAYHLAKTKLKVALFEKGKDIQERICPNNLNQTYCLKCNPCNITCGVGGAGGLSDGKLNFINPDYPSTFEVGGNFLDIMTPGKLAKEMAKVEKIFLKHGASKKIYGTNVDKIKEFQKKANSAAIELVPLKQRHIGTSKLPKVIKSIENYLIKNGIKIYPKSEVEAIEVQGKKIKTRGGKEFYYRYLVLGVGREGAKWLEKIVQKSHIKLKDHQGEGGIDVGVRVEVPSSIMEEITSVLYDPKLKIMTKKHDDYLRTFCTCPQGEVMRENYDDFCLVNGHTNPKRKTRNTNFALLGHYTFTEPFKKPNEWGRSLAKITTALGGNNPILQRLKDLKWGRRSTLKRIENNVVLQPTLKTAVPGDITLAYPGRIVDNIVDALEQIDKIIPGVAGDSTLLYAPEIKFYSLKVDVDNEMRTNFSNVYTIGDGAGISRGIVGAAVTGLIAAESIENRSK